MSDQSESGWMGFKFPAGWPGAASWQGAVGAEAQTKTIERLASNLHKVFNETCSLQMETSVRVNDKVTHSLQALMRCHQPQEFAVAESNLIVALLEGVAMRAQAWASAAQKLGDCWSDWAKEVATEKTAVPDSPAAEPALAPKRSASR
ncbi:MAG TPA: hypothetical protein VMU69_21275 [Bradyrhizobium sp.]|nr:hypothetical protein [Bradyrhizobium sp.]